jgi:LacI family transcriptional regulator
MAWTIGIVSIGQEPAFFSGRYFREVATAAGEEAVARGARVTIIPLSHEHGQRAEAARAAFAAQKADALLIVAPSESLLDAVDTMFQTTPGILLAPPRLETPLSYIASDNFGATRALVDHLANGGRKRILLLLPHPMTGDYWERRRGYEAGVAARGLPRLVGALPHPITAEVVDRSVLVAAPDALIAPSDNDALALLARLRRRGVNLPGQIALAGFDDEEFAAETAPSLTTVAQPVAEMARRATRHLIERLAGRGPARHQEILPNQLIVRDSTAPAVRE